MKTECPNCDRWYDLPTEPGDYACETCGRKYHISRTSTPPAITHHCPNCEQTARELADLRARLAAKAEEWAAARTNFRVIDEDLAKNQAAKELRALLAETEAK